MADAKDRAKSMAVKRGKRGRRRRRVDPARRRSGPFQGKEGRFNIPTFKLCVPLFASLIFFTIAYCCCYTSYNVVLEVYFINLPTSQQINILRK
jgi:hypothetical protein